MCISDIPVIYIVVHCACLWGSDEVFCLMAIYTYFKFCCYVCLPLLILRKLQCWRLHFHELALPLLVFLKEKNEDHDLSQEKKVKSQTKSCDHLWFRM